MDSLAHRNQGSCTCGAAGESGVSWSEWLSGETGSEHYPVAPLCIPGPVNSGGWESAEVPSPGEYSSTNTPMFDQEPGQESSNSPLSSFSPAPSPRLIACDPLLLLHSSQHEHCSPPSLQEPAAATPTDEDGSAQDPATYAPWGADCVAEANVPCPPGVSAPEEGNARARKRARPAVRRKAGTAKRHPAKQSMPERQAADVAKFEEWGLEGASLKCVTINGKIFFQLQFGCPKPGCDASDTLASRSPRKLRKASGPKRPFTVDEDSLLLKLRSQALPWKTIHEDFSNILPQNGRTIQSLKLRYHLHLKHSLGKDGKAVA